MQFIELPEIKEDGSVDGMVRFGPDEVKTLLQFAVNFLGSVGHTATMMAGTPDESDHELND